MADLELEKSIIDFDTYIHLADDIACTVMERLFWHLIPEDDEEYDPDGVHKQCAETEDEIRMIAREQIEAYFYIKDAPEGFLHKDPEEYGENMQRLLKLIKENKK